MNWSDKYSINNKAIDSQRKKLFAMSDRLKNKDTLHKEEFLEVIGFLVVYTSTYLNEEERIMYEKGYPKAEEHASLHESLTAMVNSMFYDFNDMPIVLPYETLESLVEIVDKWLIGHVSTHDLEFRDYVDGLKN